VRDAAAQHGIELTVLENATNEGFTPAVNRGLRAAGYRHCLVLNNDCFIGPNCVEWLWWTLTHESRCAAAGPLTCDHGAQSLVPPERSRNVGARPEIREVWNDPVAAARLLDQRHRSTAAPMVAFFCTLLHRDALRQVGLLDDRFPTGLAADDEWCHRVRRAGWRCLVVLNAWAAHLQSQTFHRLGLDYNRLHKEAWAILRQSAG
jgi:GT2 family glycosyltransferase